MLYSKPEDMKYTDMAIYIDANISKIVIPNENPDIEEKIFHYMYSICYVLACKGKFFTKFEDYDGFSVYAAGQVYMLMRDKYKHQGEIRRGKETLPVKSSLNYIKSVLYAFKVNYQKENFAFVVDEKYCKNVDTEAFTETLRSDVRNDYHEDIKNAILEDLKQLPKIIYDIVEETPYSKDKLITHNLYMSCLLSMLDSIVIPNSKSNFIRNDNLLFKAYDKEKNNIILWHLEDNMVPTIKLLINKTKIKMSKEINETKDYLDLDEEVVDSILKTAYNTDNSNSEDLEDS